jgi:hypothetical protein
MKKTFKTLLEKHDWYYDFSDDHSVWMKGQSQKQELIRLSKELKCPFTFEELFRAFKKLILENYFEVSPGKFCREKNPKPYPFSLEKKDLITQARVDEIMEWLDK